MFNTIVSDFNIKTTRHCFCVEVHFKTPRRKLKIRKSSSVSLEGAFESLNIKSLKEKYAFVKYAKEKAFADFPTIRRYQGHIDYYLDTLKPTKKASK